MSLRGCLLPKLITKPSTAKMFGKPCNSSARHRKKPCEVEENQKPFIIGNIGWAPYLWCWNRFKTAVGFTAGAWQMGNLRPRRTSNMDTAPCSEWTLPAWFVTAECHCLSDRSGRWWGTDWYWPWEGYALQKWCWGFPVRLTVHMSQKAVPLWWLPALRSWTNRRWRVYGHSFLDWASLRMLQKSLGIDCEWRWWRLVIIVLCPFALASKGNKILFLAFL